MNAGVSRVGSRPEYEVRIVTLNREAATPNYGPHADAQPPR
jgi:hypothetical protein